MRHTLLFGVACAALLAPAASAKKAKDPPPIQASHGVYVRAGFDTDPSAYIGRFVRDRDAASESAAMETACSAFITPKVVGGGGVTYSEYFTSSASASAARVEYTLTRKMQFEIADPAGFEACCKGAPDQCSETFIGEFFEGTGRLLQEASAGADAGAELHDGRYWRSSVSFNEPVYFAFKVAENQYTGGAQEVGLHSGSCDEVTWDEVPPQSSQGWYFIGVSDYHYSEQAARDDAMRNARVQVVRWLAESIEVGTVRTTKTIRVGADLKSWLEEEAVLETAAAGVAHFVKDHAWCSEISGSPSGVIYRYKVAAFLPRSEASTAAVIFEDAPE